MTSPRLPLFAVGACALLLFCIAPLLMMLAAAGTGESGLAFGLDERQRSLLARSTRLAAATAIVSSAVGAPLGILLARGNIVRRSALRLLLLIPLTLPPYVTGLAWVYAGGLGFVAGPAGVILVLALAYYGIPMLAAEAALARVDASLEEAALVSAGRGRAFLHITVPLTLSGFAAGTLIVFVLALSELGVPALLQVPVYPTEVFTAFATFYDFARAAGLALPLALAAAAAGLLVSAMIGTRWLTSARSTLPPGLRLTGTERRAAAAWAALVAVSSIVVPAIVLGNEALQSPTVIPVVLGSGSAIANSLMVSAAAATVSVACALAIGYARGRGVSRAWTAVDALLLTLFAVPGTVLGVGLIALWNRGAAGLHVYNTPLMLVLACVGRFLPLAALVAAAATRHVATSQEEAAAVAGASWLRTFRCIVLPQVRLWAAGAWVVVFILSFGELGASVLISPAGSETLPIRIYTMVANAPPGHLAALALLQALVIVTCLAAFVAIARGRRA